MQQSDIMEDSEKVNEDINTTKNDQEEVPKEGGEDVLKNLISEGLAVEDRQADEEVSGVTDDIEGEPEKVIEATIVINAEEDIQENEVIQEPVQEDPMVMNDENNDDRGASLEVPGNGVIENDIKEEDNPGKSEEVYEEGEGPSEVEGEDPEVVREEVAKEDVMENAAKEQVEAIYIAENDNDILQDNEMISSSSKDEKKVDEEALASTEEDEKKPQDHLEKNDYKNEEGKDSDKQIRESSNNQAEVDGAKDDVSKTEKDLNEPEDIVNDGLVNQIEETELVQEAPQKDNSIQDPDVDDKGDHEGLDENIIDIIEVHQSEEKESNIPECPADEPKEEVKEQCLEEVQQIEKRETEENVLQMHEKTFEECQNDENQDLEESKKELEEEPPENEGQIEGTDKEETEENEMNVNESEKDDFNEEQKREEEGLGRNEDKLVRIEEAFRNQENSDSKETVEEGEKVPRIQDLIVEVTSLSMGQDDGQKKEKGMARKEEVDTEKESGNDVFLSSFQEVLESKDNVVEEALTKRVNEVDERVDEDVEPEDSEISKNSEVKDNNQDVYEAIEGDLVGDFIKEDEKHKATSDERNETKSLDMDNEEKNDVEKVEDPCFEHTDTEDKSLLEEWSITISEEASHMSEVKTLKKEPTTDIRVEEIVDISMACDVLPSALEEKEGAPSLSCKAEIGITCNEEYAEVEGSFGGDNKEEDIVEPKNTETQTLSRDECHSQEVPDDIIDFQKKDEITCTDERTEVGSLTEIEANEADDEKSEVTSEVRKKRKFHSEVEGQRILLSEKPARKQNQVSSPPRRRRMSSTTLDTEQKPFLDERKPNLQSKTEGRITKRFSSVSLESPKKVPMTRRTSDITPQRNKVTSTSTSPKISSKEVFVALSNKGDDLPKPESYDLQRREEEETTQMETEQDIVNEELPKDQEEVIKEVHKVEVPVTLNQNEGDLLVKIKRRLSLIENPVCTTSTSTFVKSRILKRYSSLKELSLEKRTISPLTSGENKDDTPPKTLSKDEKEDQKEEMQGKKGEESLLNVGEVLEKMTEEDSKVQSHDHEFLKDIKDQASEELFKDLKVEESPKERLEGKHNEINEDIESSLLIEESNKAVEEVNIEPKSEDDVDHKENGNEKEVKEEKEDKEKNKESEDIEEKEEKEEKKVGEVKEENVNENVDVDCKEKEDHVIERKELKTEEEITCRKEDELIFKDEVFVELATKEIAEKKENRVKVTAENERPWVVESWTCDATMCDGEELRKDQSDAVEVKVEILSMHLKDSHVSDDIKTVLKKKISTTSYKALPVETYLISDRTQGSEDLKVDRKVIERDKKKNLFILDPDKGKTKKKESKEKQILKDQKELQLITLKARLEDRQRLYRDPEKRVTTAPPDLKDKKKNISSNELEFKRIKSNIEEIKVKIQKNQKKKKDFEPYVYNSLQPYGDTNMYEVVRQQTPRNLLGTTCRVTAVDLCDPWENHRMDKISLPAIRDSSSFFTAHVQPRTHRLTIGVRPMSTVSKKPNGARARPIKSSDYSQRAKSQEAKIRLKRMDEDYQRTRTDLYRLSVDKLSKDKTTMSQTNVRSALFAYLQNSPGSKKALYEVVRPKDNRMKSGAP